jgi:LCP family protein required for cell wall assembly
MKHTKSHLPQERQPHLFGEGAPYQYHTPEPPKRSRWRIVKRVLFGLFAVVFLVGTWLGWGFYRDAAKLTGNNNPAQVLSMFLPAQLQTSKGRVNILVAGYSADDPGHGGATLTDSIMLVSVDLDGKSAVVISIPRDLYVDLGDSGHAKINAAYPFGKNFTDPNYPSGGMGLLEKTVEEDFGVDINYYGLVNYAAFRSAVDAVGGVTITIASTDPDGIYDSNTKIKLSNGPTALNGQMALDLARSRGEGYGSYGFGTGDFQRTKHQQAILLGLKQKSATTTVITNPFVVSKLVGAIGDNAKTDMSLREIFTLYRKGKAINDASIKTYTLNNVNGTNLLKSYRTRDGQSALIPTAGLDNYSTIRQTVQQLLASAPPAS